MRLIDADKGLISKYNEIEPDGYVDSDGISYLTIYIAQREKGEEMPFK